MKTSWIFQPCLMTEMYYDWWPMAWVWGTTTGRARLCFDPPRRKAPGVDRRWSKCCWVWNNMRNYSNSRPEIHRITILETLCSIFRGWTMHQHRKKVNWSTNVGCDGIGNLGVQETKKTKKDTNYWCKTCTEVMNQVFCCSLEDLENDNPGNCSVRFFPLWSSVSSPLSESKLCEECMIVAIWHDMLLWHCGILRFGILPVDIQINCPGSKYRSPVDWLVLQPMRLRANEMYRWYIIYIYIL